MKQQSLLIVLLNCMLFFACEERTIVTPKPKGYFRIDLPKHEYKQSEIECPFVFEYPLYAKIVLDNDANAEPCWFNIEFPKYNATIHLSYKHVDNNITQYLEDSRTLVYKHSVKADAIDEKLYMDSVNNVFGTFYDIKGNAASSLQFYLTDSVHHFVRGALYFNNVPNKDSLAPVIEFVRQDMQHLIENFKWK